MTQTLETISYYMDWDAATWVNNDMTSAKVISVMCQYSPEVAEAYRLAYQVQSTTTAHPQHNVIKFILKFTLTEQNMTYLMLKYPNNKRVIPLDNNSE